MYKITLIIPVYNAGKYLRDLLRNCKLRLCCP